AVAPGTSVIAIEVVYHAGTNGFEDVLTLTAGMGPLDSALKGVGQVPALLPGLVVGLDEDTISAPLIVTHVPGGIPNCQLGHEIGVAFVPAELSPSWDVTAV